MVKFYSNITVAGNYILAREVSNSKRTNRRIPYKPTLYVRSEKPSGFKTIKGDFLCPMEFESMKEARDWVKQYEGVPNMELFGNTQFQYSWIAEEYPQKSVEYDYTKLSVWSLDIEVEAENGFPNVEDCNERVNLITFKNIHTQEVCVFALPFHGSKKQPFKTTNTKVQYFAYDTEEELLVAFLNTWADVQPDIVTGWNLQLFDTPYLIKRMYKLLDSKMVDKALSPWNNVRESSISFMGQEKPSYLIAGVSLLDYLRLYKKYIADPRENYKLGYIAETDLGITKVDHEEYDKFADFYKQDWQKYVEYNIRDVELVEALDAKWKLIDMILWVAYRGKVNYDDVLSQTRVWDIIIYNALRAQNKVIPIQTPHSKEEKFEGAYVKEPKPGMYHWVVSYDVQSLYPNIMRILNIGFETKILANKQAKIPLDANKMLNGAASAIRPGYMPWIDYCRSLQMTLASNGVCYVKEQKSILSELLEELFNVRLEYKAKMKDAKKAGDNGLVTKYDTAQQAVKIILNSCYGALGCQYFRYYDTDNAEAVTLTGQFIIRYIERGINKYLNSLLKTKKDFVVAIDTDSNYIVLDDLVKQTFPEGAPSEKILNYLSKVCDGPMQDLINKLFTEICEQINGMDPKLLKMVREVVADKGIWTSKKRYILNVLDSEGTRYPEPKLKMKGIEIVKASNPKFCRDRMKEAVKIIMNTGSNDELIQFINKTKTEFFKMPPAQISSPRGMNGLAEYGNEKTIYGHKTPLHTKGALLYNHYLREKKLTQKYPFIQEGEKIKFVYLKLPNPIREKVIAFTGDLPVELNLHKYIDYDLQFEKTFLDPLDIILKAIKWTHEKVASLEKWF